jgi:hypothetical protein
VDNQVILRLAAENGMGGVDNLVNIYWGLSSVLAAGVDGAVAEIGCYEGRTSVLLRMVIDHYAPERQLHVFDSFAGLPAPGPNATRRRARAPSRTSPDPRRPVTSPSPTSRKKYPCSPAPGIWRRVISAKADRRPKN